MRETNEVKLPLGIYTHYKPQMRISKSHLKHYQCAPLRNLNLNPQNT